MAHITSKGLVRREKLVTAALTLLQEQSPDQISLKDIARKADIPVGSAYHFFANSLEVFSHCVERFGQELIQEMQRGFSPYESSSWEQIYRTTVDRAVAIYQKKPAYCQLILGGNVPPSVKLTDRESDVKVGEEFLTVIKRYFKVPDQPGLAQKIFYSIEVVDLFLSLSFIHNQTIVPDMVEDAKAAGISYLHRYLPAVLPERLS